MKWLFCHFLEIPKIESKSAESSAEFDMKVVTSTLKYSWDRGRLSRGHLRPKSCTSSLNLPHVRVFHFWGHFCKRKIARLGRVASYHLVEKCLSGKKCHVPLWAGLFFPESKCRNSLSPIFWVLRFIYPELKKKLFRINFCSAPRKCIQGALCKLYYTLFNQQRSRIAHFCKPREFDLKQVGRKNRLCFLLFCCLPSWLFYALRTC